MSDEYNISENFDAINDLVKMTQQLGKQAVIAYKPAYSGDTRSAIPVIPVHSVVDFQYRRQN